MNRIAAAFPVLITFVFASVAVACQVPVFRYALERWESDAYEVIVLCNGGLQGTDAERLDKLSQGTSANVMARSVDVTATTDEALRKLWKEHHVDNQPLMLVLYPRAAQSLPNRVADVDAFTDESVSRLLHSPARQKLVDQLLSGESAVWIFVPCGNQEFDTAAKNRLEEYVKLNQQQLELPPQEEIIADEFYDPNNAIELRIGFSILTLDRSDLKEQFLLRSLLGSEADLAGLDEPMAFPVLGRGRVLYALVGEGIVRHTIDLASRFIVGPCSCQIKAQNPGFDLLLQVDWENKLQGSKLSPPAPELSNQPVLLTIPQGKKR